MSVTGQSSASINKGDLFDRLDRLVPPWPMAVALSGGADSKALTLLVHEWASIRKLPIVALTVDHGLRLEAAQEAIDMAVWCKQRDIPHEILTLKDPLPISGVQEAAREARYQTMGAYCKRNEIPSLLTGHHLDDQAETVLMRLSRGSGIEGLSAIREVRDLTSSVKLIRPLLHLPKEKLCAHLRAMGEDWIEDPSNEKDAFTRVRWRKLMPQLAEEGLDAERLDRFVRRMRAANEGLDWSTDQLADSHVTFHDLGYAEVSGISGLVRSTPAALLQRLIARCLIWANPAGTMKLERLESLIESWQSAAVSNGTLAGCALVPQEKTNRLLIVRELRDLSVLTAETDQVLWDHRFEITGLEEGMTVKALGEEGWTKVKAQNDQKFPPYVVARSLPSVWRGDELIASPLGEGQPHKITFRHSG